jgi:hypothetical protein
MDAHKRTIWLLIGYHIVTVIILAALFFSGDFQSGPCNPGLGLVIFCFAGLILLCLCLRDIFLVKRNPVSKYCLIINLCVVIIWIIVLFTL